MTIEEFHQLDLNTKLTIIYELIECVVVPLIGDPTEEE
jgi:hypothetical protein